MNPNQVIAEKMGLCWHFWHKIDAYKDDPAPTFKCSKCGLEEWGPVHKENPDYTTHEGFFKAWNWAKGQEWWKEFIGCYHGSDDVDLGLLVEVTLINPPVFAEALARFLSTKARYG